MAKRKIIDINEELLKLGLKSEQIEIFHNVIHEKHWKESIKIHKNLNIARKSTDSTDELFILLHYLGKSYDLSLEIINDEFVSFCSCSHREGEKGCEHVGAALLYKLLKEKDNDFNKKLKVFKKIGKKKGKSDLDYFKNLFVQKDENSQKHMIYFNFEEFEKDSYLLKVERGIIKKDGGYGTPMKFNAQNFLESKWKISKKVRKVLNYISSAKHYGSSHGFSKTRFYDVNTDLMMPVLRDLYFEEKEIILGVEFNKEPFEILWNISKNKEENYLVEPFFVSGKKKTSLLKMDLFEMGHTTLWVYDYKKRCFYGHHNEENLEIIRQIINLPKKLEFNEKELKEFFSKYYQKILNDFEFRISDELKRESKMVEPLPKIYLEKSGTKIKINLKFDYDGREVDYFSPNKEVVVAQKDIIYDIARDFEREEEIVDLLNENLIIMHEEKDEFILEGDLIDFINVRTQELIKLGIKIFGEDKLFNFKISKSNANMNLELTKSTDWFDIKGEIKFGVNSVHMKDLLEAIFLNKRFVELSNGKSAIIPKKWIDGLKSYSEFFDFDDDSAKISNSHVAIIHQLIEMSSKVNMSEGVTKIISKFKDFKKIESVPLPKNVNAKLRNYQKAGYDWLNFLTKFELNGILADDMGLGKTLQVLSLFQKIKNDSKTKKSFLVIVPTSLIFNWKNEIKKFTPDIGTCVHHGQKRIKSKKKFEEMIKKNDLIITTYGVLRNDLDLFTKIEFDYVVLDEAQMIKNPFSISAKCACALKSKNKLVVSGTPIQNNLMELWSLFQFLNPNYLGGYEFFRENFVVPIEKGHEKDVSSSLRKLINPFILRRTKEVISDELPAKTEVVLKSKFSTSEAEIYETWRDYYKEEIKSTIKQKGIKHSRMKILEGLMKLRQVCLHPKMVDANYKGSSAKFDLLMMEIEKVLSEGHKVLVFSSFVKMLSIVKSELDSKQIKYSYLDGKTRNREEVVTNFQESEDPQAFLISIKAGGLGLNLTSADYVFIIDPWWNPAVEMQAMDRAHRIGQKKKVFVYKMISEDTIEEKILELQESKKKLVQDLIVEDKNLMKSIDIKDIKNLFG